MPQLRGVFPEHSTAPGLQTPQVPVPLHTPVPASPAAHEAPTALFGCVGFGPSQASDVQALPSSAGKSAPSAAVANAALSPQLIFLQSPFTCAESGTKVPAGAELAPQTPPTHTATSHGLARAAHSFAFVHVCGGAPASTVTVAVVPLHAATARANMAATTA